MSAPEVCSHGRLRRSCEPCALREELDAARAENADLRARLKAVRKLSLSPAVYDARDEIQTVSDLRVKRWRK